MYIPPAPGMAVESLPQAFSTDTAAGAAQLAATAPAAHYKRTHLPFWKTFSLPLNNNF